MNRLRRGRWVQLAAALALLAATGALYAYLARAPPPVPRATIRPGYQPSVCLFSPDGQVLVTCNAIPDTSRREVDDWFDEPVVKSCRIDLWDVATGEHRCSLAEGNINPTIKFSPDGQRLSVGCPASGLVLWDVATGARSAHKRAQNGPRTIPRHYRDWCFSPDWRFILLSTDYKCSPLIALWEVATQAEQVLAWGGLKHLQF